MTRVLLSNLLSPITLAFALGVFTRLVRSNMSVPKELYEALSIFLLFGIGIKGGVELSCTPFAQFAAPAVVTLLLGCITPVSAFLVMRYVGRFSAADAAGIAAHYGSVSAVTFIAAQQFVTSAGHPPEGYMATLLALLESPGIHIALAIGALTRAPQAAPAAGGGAQRSVGALLHEIVTARTMVLLVGGLVIGALIGEKSYEAIKPFYEGNFKGALTIFLLEMGMVAGARLGDLRRVGAFLLGFGIFMPVLHGSLAVLLGHWAGLSAGGCTVLAAMAASASYIAAPPAVRMTLPEANPTYYLTASLGITFPFNILAGIPLYYQLACWLGGR